MERRVLLAIFLSFLGLYAYQALVVKPKPADALANGTMASNATPMSAPTPTNPLVATNPSVPTNPASGSNPPPATNPQSPIPNHLGGVAESSTEPVVSARSEQEVLVETADVIAVFTNRGARLKSYKLKHYFDGDKQPQ